MLSLKIASGLKSSGIGSGFAPTRSIYIIHDTYLKLVCLLFFYAEYYSLAFCIIPI